MTELGTLTITIFVFMGNTAHRVTLLKKHNITHEDAQNSYEVFKRENTLDCQAKWQAPAYVL